METVLKDSRSCLGALRLKISSMENTLKYMLEDSLTDKTKWGINSGFRQTEEGSSILLKEQEAKMQEMAFEKLSKK
jgi:hypothetical protein